MNFEEFKKYITTISDLEVLELLEFVSNEVKRRNKLMTAKQTSPEEAVKQFVEAMFPESKH